MFVGYVVELSTRLIFFLKVHVKIGQLYVYNSIVNLRLQTTNQVTTKLNSLILNKNFYSAELEDMERLPSPELPFCHKANLIHFFRFGFSLFDLL